MGKTYYHVDGVKTFELHASYGGKYIFLPREIDTGKETAPLVLGPNDLNFFKKLLEIDKDELDQKIKERKIKTVKDKIVQKNIDLAVLTSQKTTLEKEIQELEAELKELLTPNSIKFITEE